MGLELPALFSVERTQHIGRIPHRKRVGVAQLSGAPSVELRHRVTPISCRVFRNARTA
jgi:hypothetical protein